MTTHTLKNEEISITVNNHGAELCSLKDKNGNELLWQADADMWPRHAPNLFPIVGRLEHDELIFQGKSYPMKQHGFARDKSFECIEDLDNYLSFRLTHDDESQKQYPFEFELLVNYSINGNKLLIVYIIRNYHDQDLPFSIGGHPAFNWPLFPNTNSSEYKIDFDEAEAKNILALDNGLIREELRPSPLDGKTLNLTSGLFDKDALIFPGVESERLFYGLENGKGIEIDLSSFPDLGIWSKPNAPFVCIEPWSGHASPVGYDGEFAEKPGILVLPPFGERSFSYTLEVRA